MYGDKRSDPRRALSIEAAITDLDRNPIGSCKTFDVSQSGARIVLAQPVDLPDEFVLSLTQDGLVHRRCLVVWRKDLEVGVRFIQPRK